MVDPRTSVINVLILKRDVWSSRDLLIWLNAQLECEVAQIKDLRTGAIYCQLLHRLYPSNIRLDCVKLYTRKQNEFVLNFTLLSKSFKELRINYEVPQKQLINGIGHYFFLNWYHKFYEANVNENIKYNPRKERKFSKIGLKPCRLNKTSTAGTLKIAYNFEKFLSCAKINIEAKAHEAAEFPKREFLFVKHCTLFTNTGLGDIEAIECKKCALHCKDNLQNPTLDQGRDNTKFNSSDTKKNETGSKDDKTTSIKFDECPKMVYVLDNKQAFDHESIQVKTDNAILKDEFARGTQDAKGDNNSEQSGNENNTEDESQGTNDDNRNEDEMKKANKPLKGVEIMFMLTKENNHYHKILSRVFDIIANKDADSKDLISDLREYFKSLDKS